jgi:hypothetical protein
MEDQFATADQTKQKERRFVPHHGYYGWWDTILGIDFFWADKFIAFILYMQRFAILLTWNVGWPTQYSSRLVFMYAFLLDFSSAREGEESLGKGTLLEGCGTICRIIWPCVCIPIILTWAAIGLTASFPLYYTRTIERILWTTTRLMLLPFCNMLMRYYILNQDGDLTNPQSIWITPTSEIGVVMQIVTIGLFMYVGIERAGRQVLFASVVRHEAYIRSRELEYRLRISPTYRNERIWMISSYVYHAWFWSTARGVVDVTMICIINFVPVKVGIILAVVIMAVYAAYGIVFDLYRVVSTTQIELVYNLALFVFCIMGTIQAYDVTSTWLVDKDMDIFLWTLHGAAVGINFLLMIYYFVDSHRISGLTVAEQRANRKWNHIYGKNDGFIKMEQIELAKVEDEDLVLAGSMTRTGSMRQRSGSTFGDEDLAKVFKRRSSSVDSQNMPNRNNAASQSPAHSALAADSVASMSGLAESQRQRRKPKTTTVALREENGGQDQFYIPKTGGFLTLDCKSPHQWPVNDFVVNELLRRNQDNHLVDMLRAAKSMLERISALANTAILVPIDELKTHIHRLNQCVEHCKRYRVTHHSHHIHPLQSIFEELIENFTYELRIFSHLSITVGHNAKKMMLVSRKLRDKQLSRDYSLALVSPLMRRILVKLLSVRMFNLLIDKKTRHLILQRETAHEMDEDADEYGGNSKRKYLPGESRSEDDSDDSDDDDQNDGKPFLPKKNLGGYQAFADEGAADEDPFADQEELDPFADRPDEVQNAFEFGVAGTAAANAGGQDETLFNDKNAFEEEENDNKFAALLAKEAENLVKKNK